MKFMKYAIDLIDDYLVVIIAVFLLSAIGGRVIYLHFTGKLGSTLNDISGDVLVSKQDYGRVISADYSSSTETSIPVFGTVSGVSVPLGGGSTTNLYTKVETDSGFVQLAGSFVIKKGLKASLSSFKNGSKIFELADGDSIIAFKLTP